jgi:hypothetical protein
MYTLANNVIGQLKFTIVGGDVALVVAPLAGSPPFNLPPAPTDGSATFGLPFGIITLMDRLDLTAAKIEHVLYSGRAPESAGAFTYSGLVRGQEGTSAQGWTAGAYVIQQATAEVMQQKTLSDALRAAGALVHARDAAMTWDGTSFKFTTFQVSAIGRGRHWASGGYFTITMPANTTSVTGFGGASSQAVASGAIPIAAQTSLWYEPNISGGNASIAGNFRLVGISSDFVVPSHWIFLALHDAAVAGDKVLRVANGATLYPWIPFGFQNSWVDFGGSAATCAYYKGPDQIVRLKGSAKSGTLGVAIATVPAGFLPSGTVNYAVPSNGALGVVSVTTGGSIVAASGSNVSFGLDGITWRAEG